MIQQLETTEVRVELGIADANAGLKVLASTTSAFSEVLLCSCSESLQVGLLAAAVSFSMSDLYNTIAGGASADGAAPISVAGSSCLLMSDEDEQVYWRLSEEVSDSLSTYETMEYNTSKRISEALPKLSTVITQFAGYYEEHDRRKNSSIILEAVVELLMIKL